MMGRRIITENDDVIAIERYFGSSKGAMWPKS